MTSLALHKTCYSAQHLLGDLNLALQPSGSLPGGVTRPPRPENKLSEYLQQIGQQRLGGISWSGSFSCTGELLLTLKKPWFCDAMAGNEGFLRKRKNPDKQDVCFRLHYEGEGRREAVPHWSRLSSALGEDGAPKGPGLFLVWVQLSGPPPKVWCSR